MLAMAWRHKLENAMRNILTRLGSFAALLALSGAAFAVGDTDFTVPEPGVLELLALAGVVGWIIARKRGGK